MKRPTALELLKAAEARVMSVLSVPAHKNMQNFGLSDGGGQRLNGANRTVKTDKTLHDVCPLTKPLDAPRRAPPNFGAFMPPGTDKTDKTSAGSSAKIYTFIPKGTDKTDKTLPRGLAEVVALYGSTEVTIRARAPQPADLAKHRRWLARPTNLFGNVNARLPYGPLPPVSRLPVRAQPGSLGGRPPLNPNDCVHCRERCPPGDLTNFRQPDGRWTHLDCELKAGGVA